ncbi:MAG: hypothetical protein AAGI22_06665 [Planctomycetota bacterium]
MTPRPLGLPGHSAAQAPLRLLVPVLLAACASNVAPIQNRFGVHALPADDAARIGPVRAGELRDQGFTKGVAVDASGQGAVWIVAQEGVPDLAVARARNLLLFFLRPLPGDDGYGGAASKRQVARRMAENGAMLMMPTGEHREGEEPDLPAQPLYEEETPIDGSAWYLENDWDHRDAAFEEIFHLVHDMGIGTDFPGALPAYQRELDREARAAIADSRWGRPIDEGVEDWLRELEDENSLAQEYIASVIDTYYGLWGPFDEDPGGMWGVYCAKTRAEQAELDPKGQALLRAFLPEFLVGYEALIDPSFEGAFHARFDPDLPYTHKSRYLVEITLTGSRSSGIVGNDQDNVFRGNRGDNRIEGRGGVDTACFTGERREYSIDAAAGSVVVRDGVSGRDGADTLVGIDRLRFSDGEVEVSDLTR